MSSLEELNLRGYIKANQIEAEKGPLARKEFLKSFNRWVYRTRSQMKDYDPPLTADFV